ncbi:DUF3558 domain-containing protein [Mycobacteroides chelonae]|uniref:DUF3558 domain-containing protein n=1 Tax=Mycobacteroides chelonae TaxID=1774 RepID=UPI0009C15AAD|nr:DUF3558 domain-containing protein [Mycobacteroides chelonae]
MRTVSVSTADSKGTTLFRLTRRLTLALVSLTVLVSSCASTKTSTDGTAVTQPVSASASTSTTAPATNAGGRPKITFDPCRDIPTSALQAENLSMPRPTRRTDGDIEDVSCAFRPQPTDYRVRIGASNYTLDMDKKVDGHWGFQDTTVGGRKALFFYPVPQNTSGCVIDIEATTGVYGVLITGDYKYGPYPDCMAAARHYAEAFVQYFPA